MQIEDFIYDAAVLRMGVCLERFLKRDPSVTSDKLSDMIKQFCARGEKRDDKAYEWMDEIRKARNDAAHWNEKNNKSAHPDNNSGSTPVFNFDRFQKIRKDGIKLDAHLNEKMGCDTGMSEIMISSSLPYDMGNAGDLLKHGALATFVDWFLECREKRIHYADPFAGRPWGYILKKEIRRRMEGFSSSLPVINNAQPHWRKNSHQPHWRKDRYYGSSHVVWNIAKAKSKGAKIFASDKDKLARSDLEASGIRQIEDHCPKNGFGILDKKHDERRFDLILLDPFADFLLNEFGHRRETSTAHFESISESVERNPGLCVMLFVLVMEDTNIFRQYDQEKNKYSRRSFRLHCPKMEMRTGVDGEAGYDMEVLLISNIFAERSDSVIELKRRLDKLRRVLEDVLPNQAKKIEFRSPDWLDRSLTARKT